MSEQELMTVRDGMEVTTERRPPTDKEMRAELRSVIRDAIREETGGLTMEDARKYVGRLLLYYNPMHKERAIVRLVRCMRSRCEVMPITDEPPKEREPYLAMRGASSIR
jgi:hypothetical protein